MLCRGAVVCCCKTLSTPKHRRGWRSARRDQTHDIPQSDRTWAADTPPHLPGFRERRSFDFFSFEFYVIDHNLVERAGTISSPRIQLIFSCKHVTGHSSRRIKLMRPHQVSTQTKRLQLISETCHATPVRAAEEERECAVLSHSRSHPRTLNYSPLLEKLDS